MAPSNLASTSKPSAVPAVVILAIPLLFASHALARSIPVGERIVVDPERQTAEIVFTQQAADPALDIRQAAIEYIATRPDLFQLEDPESELVLTRERADKAGRTHLRYQQEYRGLPVWGCQKIVHFDADRSIYLVAGQTIATPMISTLPGIDAPAAVDISRRELSSLRPPADAETETELLIYPDGDRPVLAWLVTTKWTDVSAYRWRMFVDANTSEVLLSYNDVCDQIPAVGTGIDVEGFTRTLQTAYYNPDPDEGILRPYLADLTRPMYSGGGMEDGVIVTYDDLDNGGWIFVDPDNDNVFDDLPWLRAAVSGHYHAGLTYDYYLNTFGWDSYNNQGSSVIVTVVGFIWYNAQWSGEFMRFGRGNGTTFLDLSGALDVVAHEFTHGVTEYTAGLAYLFQPGALNEAYSDFFGAMVDRDDWVMGEQICLEPPYFNRSLEDPHQGVWGPLPAHMNEYADLPLGDDWGGVHVNMGIPDKAGYLMATATSREVAEQIWFHALTNYLTPMSDFYFWAEVVFQSAVDLYGFPSAEADAVSAALDSVGLGAVTALPQCIEPLTVALGSTADTTLRLRNLNIQSLDLLGVSNTQAEFTVTGTFPQTLGHGDSAVFTLSYDATGTGSECDIGYVYDTLVFTTSSGYYSQVRVPVVASVAFTPVPTVGSTLSTNCTDLGVENGPRLNSLAQAGIESMAYGSLMIGMLDGSDTTVYANTRSKSGYHVDQWYGKTFGAIDEFVSGTDVRGRETRSVRIATEDGRVQGSIRYRFDPSTPEECAYYLVDYTLHNNCDTPLTMLVGVFTDFDLTGNSDFTGYAAAQELVYMRTPGGKAAGWAMLVGSARNLRAISYNGAIFTGFYPGVAYRNLDFTTNSMGASQADWCVLLTFGDVTLAAGDSVTYTAILLQSDQATIEADVTAIRSNMCGVAVEGDANDDGFVTSSDIIYMVNHVFKSGPNPVPCAASGDATADGVLTSADIIWMVNYVFKSGIPPLDVCDLVPDTWPCY